MRDNLVGWLDDLGLHEGLDIPTCARLFDSHWHLVHTTSVVRYPVLYDYENYTGRKPPLLKSELLRGYAEEFVAEELPQLTGALIVPLGSTVGDVLRELTRPSGGDPYQILWDFPHPSPGTGFPDNLERFMQRREDLQRQVRDWLDRRL